MLPEAVLGQLVALQGALYPVRSIPVLGSDRRGQEVAVARCPDVVDLGLRGSEPPERTPQREVPEAPCPESASDRVRFQQAVIAEPARTEPARASTVGPRTSSTGESFAKRTDPTGIHNPTW